MAPQSFQNFIADAGYSAPNNIIPGKIIALPGLNKRKGNKAARCLLFPDMRGGWFMDYSTGLFEIWQAKRETPYTKEEQQAFREQCERDRLAREAETTKNHAAAAEKAQRIRKQSVPITERHQHTYLIKKRIQSHTARLFRDVLAIPIYDENRQLVNLQFINVITLRCINKEITTMAFKKGESGNPAGRRPGSTAGAKLRKSIEAKTPAILKTVIDAAIAGDMQAAKILLDRIIPVLKAQALPITVDIGANLPETGGNVINATMAGQIPPDIGSQLITALSAQAKIIEQQEIIERLARIERQLSRGEK